MAALCSLIYAIAFCLSPQLAFCFSPVLLTLVPLPWGRPFRFVWPTFWLLPLSSAACVW